LVATDGPRYGSGGVACMLDDGNAFILTSIVETV
jgi:hypothetical protein